MHREKFDKRNARDRQPLARLVENGPRDGNFRVFVQVTAIRVCTEHVLERFFRSPIVDVRRAL